MRIMVVVTNRKEWPFKVRGIEIVDARSYLTAPGDNWHERCTFRIGRKAMCPKEGIAFRKQTLCINSGDRPWLSSGS
jgi:hypothetical protein